MKKFFSLLMGVLLVASMGLIAFAQEVELPEEVDEEAKEATVMDTPAGKEVRMMQVGNAFARNAIVGQKAIETVLEKNPEADTAELERIVAELETIREESEEKIQQGEIQGKEPSEVIEEFVTLKKEGRNLSNEFRERVQGFLDDDEREQIREEARQRADEELGEDRQNIQERIKEHNAEQVEHVFERLGVENESLVEKVRNGDINTGEAISQVAREFRGLGEGRRQEAKVQMDVARMDRAENSQQAVSNARENLEERMNDRASGRMDKVEEKLNQVRERIKENLPEQARGKLEERMGPSAGLSGGENDDEESSQNGRDSNETGGGVPI
ncbi:MAG: hypothetical protein ACOCQG_02235 [Candidatus Nanoarchaeia archaeon]